MNRQNFFGDFTLLDWYANPSAKVCFWKTLVSKRINFFCAIRSDNSRSVNTSFISAKGWFDKRWSANYSNPSPEVCFAKSRSRNASTRPFATAWFDQRWSSHSTIPVAKAWSDKRPRSAIAWILLIHKYAVRRSDLTNGCQAEAHLQNLSPQLWGVKVWYNVT